MLTALNKDHLKFSNYGNSLIVNTFEWNSVIVQRLQPSKKKEMGKFCVSRMFFLRKGGMERR